MAASSLLGLCRRPGEKFGILKSGSDDTPEMSNLPQLCIYIYKYMITVLYIYMYIYIHIILL